MAEILFNNNGVPLMATGKTFFASTTGAPEVEITAKKKKQDDVTTVKGNDTVVEWGSNNTFPDTAQTIIGKTGVLNTALKLNVKVILGQGIFPVKVTGYDEKGNEKYEVINDKELTKFLKGRVVRNYLEKAQRDITKFGVAFPELILSEDRKKMAALSTINARYCRLIEAKKGVIEKVAISGNWGDSPSEDYETIDVLDNYDPEEHLHRLRMGKKLGKKYIYLLQDPWSNNDYYPTPDWYTAYNAGWVDVANKVPQFLKKAYDNQASWLWHIQIPYAYWDRRFPKSEYKDLEVRKQKIQDEMDAIEESITGTENANKAIFTHFEIGTSGRAEEQWKIEALDNKYKADDKLITSAAANSEILFSLMINPNLLGAGMPGGTYAGNQGGSNIREAFLVNIALAWLDRQRLLDPVETYLRFNGYEDVELRFRNTILTTLDTGAGTTNNLS